MTCVLTSICVAAGALSGKGKIPYAILGLLDVIRHYPGQVGKLLEILQYTLQLYCRDSNKLCLHLCMLLMQLACEEAVVLTIFATVQIPDIDAILHTSDFSCVKATPAGQQPAGPPIFGYNSDPAHEDVPFPDYSYWGHEYTRLRGELSWGTCMLAASHILSHTCKINAVC